VTRAERIAYALAEQLGAGLDPAAMATRAPFRRALADALAILNEDAVVAAVVARGTLAGSRNPHAVCVSRLRELVAVENKRREVADERAEARRWAAVDRAARRGETLRALVERGSLFADEAAGMVAREFTDDDLRGIAVAALTGGRQ
jgi:hypothetical protein